MTGIQIPIEPDFLRLGARLDVQFDTGQPGRGCILHTPLVLGEKMLKIVGDAIA